MINKFKYIKKLISGLSYKILSGENSNFGLNKFSAAISTKNHNNLIKMVNNETTVTYLDIPDKSENDKKHYKTLVLANGLHALLVSDPTPKPQDGTSSTYDSNGDSCAEETNSEAESSSGNDTGDEDNSSDSDDSEEGDEKLAACALLVDVGSFSEPVKAQGLAHFLEHMIFMGSEKYPTENAFDSHIKKCGGFDNAHTAEEETVFYFEVSEEHLSSSMDYFTALFKAPLMKKEAMQREREAVESEFQQTLHDDETRRDQILASLAAPNYPQGTFTWGNLKSLKQNIDDDTLHELLHEFRKRHYSANRMYLCVQARLPIEELEQLVVQHCSDIPNNTQLGKDFTTFKYNEAFREDFFNKVFFVKPVENTCKLELTWVLPPMSKLYRCKPDQYFAYLFGYEGEGSLCAYLRKKLWGLELISGVDESGFDSNSVYSLFNLCIYLTEQGFEHLDEVLQATFAFIKLFTNCEDLKPTYKELQSIEANSFRFEPQKPAYDNVQHLVWKSKYYPPKDMLTGTELYFEYNEQQIQTVIDHLNQFHFNIMVTSQQKYEGIRYDQQEKWFGTQYTSIDMSEKWRDLWLNSKPMPELFLPKPNRFLTEDFRLFWVEDGSPEIPAVPKKILQTDVCELWFRQDDKFRLPEAYMYFYFISPLLRKSPENDVMCALYAQLVKYRLGEELYPATIAGLNYQFYSAERGTILKVYGYNEKLPMLVTIIVKAMISMGTEINEEQLEVFKTHQKKAYFNSLIKPKALSKDIRLSILERIRWPMINKYKCLNDIKLEHLLEFVRQFPNELYVQTLMQGNLKEETAHNVMNSVLSLLNCQPIKEKRLLENRTIQLPQGSHFIRCHALNDKDVNTVICNFYQIGPCTVRMESILDLLMMFVEEPLFDNLRTKEQLGYYVSAAVRVNYGVAGYTITVNSQETRFDAQHVEERIEVFRNKMLDILDEMTDEEFDQVRESLIRNKQVVDMSMNDEITRNWGEITCEEYFFDRKKKEIDVLRTLTKSDIIEFCLNNEKTNLRKLSVQVIGNKPAGFTADMQKAELLAAETVQQNEQDTEDVDVDDEELFNALANKLDLVFIEKEDDAATITNIPDFKENLHVYPISRTNKADEDITADGRISVPPAEIIEDC